MRVGCTSEHSQVMHVTCMVVLGSHVVLVRYHNALAMLIVMGGEEIQRGLKNTVWIAMCAPHTAFDDVRWRGPGAY